jgi:glucose/arabinose dehydrogenase
MSLCVPWRWRIATVLVCAFVWLLPSLAGAGDDGRLDELRLPPGFAIQVYRDRLPNARSLALGEHGTLFVGTRRSEVYAVERGTGADRGGAVHVIAQGLYMPNGVAFRDGALYVAEVNRILRYDGIETRVANPPAPAVVTAAFPGEQHHGWKYIAFGPDGWLYVPVGAPCNICEPDSARYANISRIRPDGSGLEVYARGIRNSVGMDWQPGTGALFFTDNGRDMLGDDEPADEINRAAKPGLHFGYPYCHGGVTPDPEFGAKRPCADFEPPARRLGAHVAPLGIHFYRGNMFPQEFRGRMFVAEHGSWNRSRKSGYRVMTATLEGDRIVRYEPFIEGWLKDESSWGRPVAMTEMPDGSLLLSDDQLGVVYRITYSR